MSPLEWTLIQYDWWPYENRLGHRHVQRRDRGST